jgi:hypothetical protein
VKFREERRETRTGSLRRNNKTTGRNPLKSKTPPYASKHILHASGTERIVVESVEPNE